MLEDLPHKLIGRDDLIAEINPLLDVGETVLLQGFGGMGKSALAATVAAGRINGRPVLWQRLGTETPDAAFEAITRPFNAQQAVAAAKADEKRSVVRGLLVQARVGLVVLDDAWDGETLNAVLRAIPQTVPILVTSRHRYPVGKIIRVDELPPDKALEVLEYYAGTPCRTDPKAADLCKLLGYHAFALEVAGRTMQSSDLIPSELYRRIHDKPFEMQVPGEFSQEGRRTVANLLNASLTLLDNETQAVFMGIGAFFDKQITPELLAIYMGQPISDDDNGSSGVGARGPSPLPPNPPNNLPPGAYADAPLPHRPMQRAAVEKALEELSLRGLAEKIKADERNVTHYRLHDLAFAYAQASHNQENRHRALDACLLYIELHSEPNLVNFAALRPLVENLINAADWAMSRGLYAEVERFAWKLYADETPRFLVLQGYLAQALSLLEKAAQAAEQAGNRWNQGAHLGNLGIAYAALGQYQQAIDYYQQALTIAREIGDRGGEGVALGNLGNAYASLGQYAQAIEYYQGALTISREIGDRRGEGNRLGNLGIAYTRLGQYAQAIEYYQQALTIAREIGDRLGESNHLNNIGALHEAQGDDLAQAGKVAEAQGEYRLALDFFQLARAIFAEIGAQHWVQHVDRNIAIVQKKLSGG
jgi:tetratricopeptide (TPR) repeat protein